MVKKGGDERLCSLLSLTLVTIKGDLQNDNDKREERSRISKVY